MEKARHKPDMFPAERISSIFGNIEDIYRLAQTFLADLQKHIVTDEPEMSQIGACFLRHVGSLLHIGIIIILLLIITRNIHQLKSMSHRQQCIHANIVGTMYGALDSAP